MKDMENKRIWSIIRTIILSIQLVTEVLSTVIVLQLNMLPGVYLAIFISVMVLVTGITALLMFARINDRIGLWRKIVSGILALAVICGCVLISKIAWDAHQLVSDFTGDESSAQNMYVLVLNEDPAHALKDTKNHRYGVLEKSDEERTRQMIEIVAQEASRKVEPTAYERASLMVDALYNKKVDALIMNGASISLLMEQEGYQDFLTRVRLIYTFTYDGHWGSNADLADVTKEPFAIYISGSDTRSKILDVSRSDVNILAVVNPVTKQVLLVNTPRDYYIPNPAGKGELDKLTHCSNYGVDCSIQALEELYNIQVGYYARINFTGFEKLIDAIDGVTIYSDEAFTTIEGTYIKAGENRLDGVTALQFARERYNVSGGDNGRGRNQMRVIKAVIEKMASSKTLITNYTDILSSLEGVFITSFQADEISDLVKMQLKDMSSWDVQSFAVTGRGDYQETYSQPGEDLWVMWPNQESVDFANRLIGRVLDGEILTAEDVKLPK